MYYEVIPEGRTEELTYFYDSSLSVGQIVLVPVGRREVPGVVIKKVAQPDFATKSILKVLYTKPLPRHLLDAVKFVHEYYLAPLGVAVGLVLPKGVEKQRRKRKTEQMFGNDDKTSRLGPRPAGPSPRAAGANSRAAALRNAPSPECFNHPQLVIPLNSAQKKALEGLQKAPGATKLLFGVTGSGKTNIYLKMAAKALKQQKSSIILVPEIALTGQLVQVFEEVFGERVTVIHSKQTEAERHLIFDSLLLAKEPRIVVGPRSALFAPLDNLGLIVVDEEHEGAYYQENAPRYSAIRVASKIASGLGIDLILGSATPTAEDYYLALRQEAVVEITEKAKASAVKPEVKLVDFKNRDNFRKNRYFCDDLLMKITENLAAGRQTLIFHNRRGSSPLTICENCGEELICPNCFLPLTLHADSYELVCHTCGFSEKVPAGCPKCGHPGLVHKGFGTKLLESELQRLFPKARVRRFDADNKKGEGMEAMYDDVKAGEVDILVGTQTLAKGLDLPRLATVGVVQADAGLSLPDYLAEERTFQLLTQVMGRVGRGHLSEAEVFVQTFRPEHPVLKFALNEDYKGFYEYLIVRRRKTGFPPFKFVTKLTITMKTERLVVKKVQELAAKLAADKRLIVSPPQPAFHERTVRGYTWQIIVRAKSRKALIEVCNDLDQNFKISLDPPGLL
ncbi:MAG: primosomal protein N' [Candidatus Saccharibacteria bacterium]|nr:primosomal protein N' [Candidatus Saccharibacteria bacterium]